MPPARGLKIAGSAKHGMVAAMLAARYRTPFMRPMTETASSTDDPAPQELPADPQALQALVRELIAERNAVIARCEKLEHLLRVARNAQYGRSSEKLNQDQLELTLEDVEQAVAGIEAEEDKRAPPRTANAPPRGGPIAARCRSTCRALSRRSLPKARSARAAARPCTRSAPMKASASMLFRPSSG